MAGEKQFQADLAVCADSLKYSCCIFDRVINIETMNMHHSFLHIQFIQSKQTAGQFLKTFRFECDDLQVTVLHFVGNCAVQYGIYISFDRGKRRTEIVRDIGDKFTLIVSVLI